MTTHRKLSAILSNDEALSALPLRVFVRPERGYGFSATTLSSFQI